MRVSDMTTSAESRAVRKARPWYPRPPGLTTRPGRGHALAESNPGRSAMKGRVAVLKAYGGEFELREYPVPDPEPGAILVKLTRAGVCGSDLHIWRGEMKELYGALPKDLTFGHEMAGRVERLGAGVTVDSMGQPLREGDRVTYLY